MPTHIKVWGCLIALCFGVAIGTSDPIITRVCGGFAVGACIAICLIERD